MSCCSSTSNTSQTSTATKPGQAAALSEATALPTTTAADMQPLAVAPLSSDQQGGISLAEKTAAAPPINTGTVVDESGPLGSIASYINPYVSAALAPTVRAIQLNTGQQQKTNDANATEAGAFGDARNGIATGLTNFYGDQAVGDAVGKGYSDAFNQAMQNRQIDLSRFTSEQQQDLQNAWQAVNGLMTAGGVVQGEDQAKNQSTYDYYLQKYGNDYAMLNALNQTIAGGPVTTNTNSTTTSPDNALESLLGSAVKGVAGTSAVGNAVAGGLSSAGTGLTALLGML